MPGMAGCLDPAASPRPQMIIDFCGDWSCVSWTTVNTDTRPYLWCVTRRSYRCTTTSTTSSTLPSTTSYLIGIRHISNWKWFYDGDGVRNRCSHESHANSARGEYCAACEQQRTFTKKNRHVDICFKYIAGWRNGHACGRCCLRPGRSVNGVQ